MHYEIMDVQTGELTGQFATFLLARMEAERLCALNNRQRHFSIIRMEQVFTTQTIEEALKA